MTEAEFIKDFYKYPWSLRSMYFHLAKEYNFSQIYHVLLKHYGVGQPGLPAYESKLTLRKTNQ